MTSKTLVVCALLGAGFLMGSPAKIHAAETALAQTVAPNLVTTIPPNSIRLWENDAPGALGQRPQDIPTLTPYYPAGGNRNGASMVVLPGGGYSGLADHEGSGYAEW